MRASITSWRIGIPKNKPAPLQPFRFGYTLYWEGGEADFKRSENRVISTRIGPDTQFQGARQFVIDFAGPKFDAIPEDKPPTAIANCSGGAHIADTLVIRNPFMSSWRGIMKMMPSGRHQCRGGFALLLAAEQQGGGRNLGLSMEPTLNILTNAAGEIAGRSLEEWNAAYVKVENYFHALRIRNKPLLGQLVLRVLERAQQRAPAELNRSATEIAAEEMDRLVTDWFAEVLQASPAGTDQMLSTRGRLALLLADMPGKWQDQFLRPGPWPPGFRGRHARKFFPRRPRFSIVKNDPPSAGPGPHHHAHQFRPAALRAHGLGMDCLRPVVGGRLFSDPLFC